MDPKIKYYDYLYLTIKLSLGFLQSYRLSSHFHNKLYKGHLIDDNTLETCANASTLMVNNFQRIAVSVNGTRSCAKLTVYSIAYNLLSHTHATKHVEIVLACTPIPDATLFSTSR
jgi:hypothetical protein